ncbi:MAG: hypothetical protein AB7I79_13620 [Rhizobiaceae bacterium]
MRRSIAAGMAAAVLMSSVSPVVAGGRGECYEKVHHPAVYDTVREKVLVREARRHVEVEPAIYGTQKRKVLVSHERVEYRTVPAQYKTVREKVIIQDAYRVERVVPAVTRTVERKVKVSDGGYSWEWRVIKGKRVLCKVRNKPYYETRRETVVVHPERVTYETVPARWGYETRHVKVSQEYTEKYVVPARYDYVLEQVVIQPARKRVYETPAEYAWRERTVVAREGSTEWRRVRNHCKA